MSDVPDFIANRIRRPCSTPDAIVPGSTPVIWFGTARTARIATLSINPSMAEFVAGARELTGLRRRLHTLTSLDVHDLTTASNETVRHIVDYCDGYFDRNPYTKWFGPMDTLLQLLGVSYFDGTACHLDVVQWATAKVWGKVPHEVCQRLIMDDRPFLIDLLEALSIDTLLVNGRTALNQVRDALSIDLKYGPKVLDEAPLPSRRLPLSTQIAVGQLNGVRVIGWTANVPNGRGMTTAFRKQIAGMVAKRLSPDPSG